MSEAKVYRTDSCSVCGDQQCEDDMTCYQCGKNLIELDHTFICDGGDHYCDEECKEAYETACEERMERHRQRAQQEEVNKEEDD